MESRKEEDSVHLLQTGAESGPRRSSSEMSLCRLERPLQERHRAGRGGTDGQGIPHHSPKRVWESQGSAQGCSNPSMPQPSADLLASAPCLWCGAGCWAQHHNTVSRVTAVLSGPFSCSPAAQRGISALFGELCPTPG